MKQRDTVGTDRRTTHNMTVASDDISDTETLSYLPHSMTASNKPEEDDGTIGSKISSKSISARSLILRVHQMLKMGDDKARNDFENGSVYKGNDKRTKKLFYDMDNVQKRRKVKFATKAKAAKKQNPSDSDIGKGSEKKKDTEGVAIETERADYDFFDAESLEKKTASSQAQSKEDISSVGSDSLPWSYGGLGLEHSVASESLLSKVIPAARSTTSSSKSETKTNSKSSKDPPGSYQGSQENQRKNAIEENPKPKWLPPLSIIDFAQDMVMGIFRKNPDSDTDMIANGEYDENEKKLYSSSHNGPGKTKSQSSSSKDTTVDPPSFVTPKKEMQNSKSFEDEETLPETPPGFRGVVLVPSDYDVQENRRNRLRFGGVSRTMIVYFGGLSCFLITGIIALSYILHQINSNKGDDSTKTSFTFRPTQSPNQSPSSLPAVTPMPTISKETIFLEHLSSDSPSIVEKIQDTNSTQYEAFEWLMNDPNYHSYGNRRAVQRWVLALLSLELIVVRSSPGLNTTSLNLDTMESWMKYDNECQWFTSSLDKTGVCDNEGWYRQLVLSNIGLEGTIPSELSLLSGLQYMNLSHNRLEGTVPFELGTLQELTVLDLGNNLLDGTIPGSICSLNQLETFRADCNTTSCTCCTECADLS